jgi:hypothetical protein
MRVVRRVAVATDGGDADQDDEHNAEDNGRAAATMVAVFILEEAGP